MKNIMLVFISLICLIRIGYAQDQTVNLPVTASDIQGLQTLQQQQQADIASQQAKIVADTNGITAAQAAIALDNNLIATEQITIDQWNAAQVPVVQTPVLTTNVNWDELAGLKASGANWSDINNTMTGINWSAVTQLNNLTGTNWNSLAGINWDNWFIAEGQGQNWEQFIKTNGN
jgi:hypothetical protein